MAVGVVVHKALIWRFGQNKFMYVVVNAAEITFLYTSKTKKKKTPNNYYRMRLRFITATCI